MPAQQGGVAGPGGVVVAPDEEVGHAQGLDSLEQADGVPLGDAAEVDQVAEVDDRVDVLLLTIVRISGYCWPPWMSETSRIRAATGSPSDCGVYLSCSAAESARRFFR